MIIGHKAFNKVVVLHSSINRWATIILTDNRER